MYQIPPKKEGAENGNKKRAFSATEVSAIEAIMSSGIKKARFAKGEDTFTAEAVSLQGESAHPTKAQLEARGFLQDLLDEPDVNIGS